MRRAIDVVEPPFPAAGTVTLDHQDRHRRRIMLEDDAGRPFLLDLAEATHLHDGDGLQLDDGSVLLVKAAAEPCAVIRSPDLVRLAWHLGNRHLAVQVEPGQLVIRADHVIEDMARHLGCEVERVERPFEPEHGAYGHHH